MSGALILTLEDENLKLWEVKKQTSGHFQTSDPGWSDSYCLCCKDSIRWSLDKEGKLQSTIWTHHVYLKPLWLLELGPLLVVTYLIFQLSGSITFRLYRIVNIHYPHSEVARDSRAEVSFPEFFIKIWPMESKDKIWNFAFDWVIATSALLSKKKQFFVIGVVLLEFTQCV